ncbi:transcriptional regulator, partial [Leclercia adecarboxylata]|nr:transcriptional regulator [Leclercia adecarboxylata]
EQNSRSWAASARALETDVANLHRLAKRLGLKG